MRQATGDMFSTKPCDAIVITTNGYVKQNGEAVMGRGCAQQSAKKWPELPGILGQKLQDHGNHVHHLMIDPDSGKSIVSFPVKPAWIIPEDKQDIEDCVVKHWRSKSRVGMPTPGFACRALPSIIMRSAMELAKLTHDHQWEDVVCPRFGCGAGELHWSVVSAMLQNILDDRFIVMTFAPTRTSPVMA